MDTLPQIEKVIAWYKSVKSDFNDVDALLRTQRHLAGLLWDFAGEIGGLYKQKNRCEFQRKAEFERERQAAMKAGDTAAKAEIEARVKVEPLIESELSADAEYRAAWILYEAAQGVLSAMVQHISHLKAEKRAEAAGQGSQG